MEMEVDDASKPKEMISEGEEQKGKPTLVILVGAPGSGKSTFCEQVMNLSTRQWVRVCQDTIGNGKAGTKAQCLKSATNALADGKSVFLDRCNLDREQRAEFVKLGSSQIDVHAVVLDLPAKLCISRSVKRTGHEGNLQGGKAAAVVNRMLQNKELPKLSEGFARITFCHNEGDVRTALNTYSALGPLDTLPQGTFGQKNPDAKVQVGIMKFFKKTESPANSGPATTRVQDSASSQISEDKDLRGPVSLTANAGKKLTEDEESLGCPVFLNDVHMLAFPSISTSDFQFNHEKASDIIVEKVEEFVGKIENAKLVLVDFKPTSNILSLVRAKVTKKILDSGGFFTFVGDITKLCSQSGLHCNVIANAANWRLKPGGGGVNAAIYSAAGPDLDIATKALAKSLLPGNSLVVPLPPTSQLFSREGVTHVIHVLGPNMNPGRPNCLNNDYSTGCKVLRKAYTSLFEGFVSIIKTQAKLPKGTIDIPGFKEPEVQNHLGGAPRISDQKIKRDNFHESFRSKKSKGSQAEVGSSISDSSAAKVNLSNEKFDGSTKKVWGSWALSLYHIAMQPEKHKEDVLEILEDVVVLNDLYPKGQKHLLVLARHEGLDQLADVRKENLHLLRTMHTVGLKWAEKFSQEDASLIFRLGYHSDPSMRQLHLHVISQDFDSKHLKHKKHWNSFNTAFFRDSVDVMEEVSNHGKAMLKDDKDMLSTELRCNRCRSAHPNIPKFKTHISNCRAPFPACLRQNGRLVCASSNAAASDP